MSDNPYPFFNEAPEGFDRTNELKWFKAGTPIEPAPAVLSYAYLPTEKCHHFDKPVYVLCQKWAIIHVEPTESGEVLSFRECWVRVPIETP